MKKILGNLDEVIGGGLISVTVILVIINVFCRYILGWTIVWAEEVATLCFMMGVFIGMAAAYKNKMHLGIDFLIQLFSEKIQKLLSIFIYFMIIIINITVIFLTLQYMKNSTKISPVLGINYKYINISLLIGFSLIIIYTCKFVCIDIKNLRRGK